MSQWMTDIHGVYASGIHAGFKADKLDLSYIYVPGAVASAGVFTQNKCCSETINYTKRNNKRHCLKAVVINAGNANTGTGEQGVKAVKETAKIAAKKLGLNPFEVGIASTGIIGVPLPMTVMKSGLDQLLSNPLQQQGEKLAEAILTTDTCVKTVFLERKIGKKVIQIAGVCKGSGMIAPNMATMLAYLVVNLDIETSLFQTWVKQAVEDSFNMITVDSDTSTSDMVLAFATGAHKVNVREESEVSAVKQLLLDACLVLAKKIVEDGEGASKLIELKVTGAATKTDAKSIAMSVLNSPLVKTAIHGEDPNWGRLIMAIGKTPNVKLNSEKISIYVGDYCIFSQGKPTEFVLDMVKKELQKDHVYLTIDIGINNGSVRAWGCDLSKAYIDINVDYN